MTYNHAPYIVDAMNGFTMQETTFPVYYLITDDASTDGEPDVIKQYLADYFQTPYRTEETDDYHLISAVHKTNPNCNFIVFLLKYNHYSIKKSKLPYQAEWRDNAKYIAFCEGDDYWIDPLKLQKQVDWMNSHPKCGLCHSSCKMLLQETNILIPDPSDDKRLVTHHVQPLDIISGYRIHMASVMMRNEIYRKARSLDPFLFSGYFLMGDTPLWWQICKLSDIYYFTEPMVVYRQVAGSASHQNGFKYYRFVVSMREMDYYLVNMDIKEQAVIETYRKRLIHGIRNYKAFNPSFESKVLPNVHMSCLCKFLIYSGILKLWLNKFKLQMIPAVKRMAKQLFRKMHKVKVR